MSLVFSLAGFLYFGLGIVSGPLADRWGSRRLAVLGMLLIGAGLAVASVARDLCEVYAAYGLGVGLGVGFSYVPALGAVQRWFTRRRGFASGLAVSGIGVGTLVMPPLASMLIEMVGWRETYLVLGCLAAVVGGGMALLIENDPAARGLGPDGDPPREDLLQGDRLEDAAGTTARLVGGRLFGARGGRGPGPSRACTPRASSARSACSFRWLNWCRMRRTTASGRFRLLCCSA